MLFSQACCLVKTSVAKTQLGLQFLEGYLKLYRRGFSKTASSASLSSCTVVLERTQEQGTGQDMSLGNSPSHERKFNRTVHIASHVRSLHTSSTDLGIKSIEFLNCNRMHMPVSCWCEGKEGVLQTQHQSEHQGKISTGCTLKLVWKFTVSAF